MSDTPSPEALAAEFDCLMARAGLRIPKRAAPAPGAYADLRGQIALLHGRYGAAAEPSNVFRLGGEVMDTQDLSIAEMGRACAPALSPRNSLRATHWPALLRATERCMPSCW